MNDRLDITKNEFEGTEDADLSSAESISLATSNEEQSSVTSFKTSPAKKHKLNALMEDQMHAVLYCTESIMAEVL
jgi:hypothetical protein